MNPDVDAFLGNVKKWEAELRLLREVALGCGLTEALKWRLPCYTCEGSNVVILQPFKEYVAIGFFKGALLKDPEGILTKPGEHTQSGRLIRFTSVDDIKRLEPVIIAYIREAIGIEKAGLKVARKKHEAYEIPQELRQALDQQAALKKAFYALTPGRQRAYILFFSAARQSPTRVSRIEKCKERILSGKGLTDCICGLTQKPPYCDGSHKLIKGGTS